MVKPKYDVIIIGGGVVGTALLYVLSKYTDIKKIALIEKYNKVGQVNSHRNNNSQTLHFGDIETNYNLEKAKKVNEAAIFLKNYLNKHEKKIFIKTSKMVLGVGKKEVELLEKRFIEFKKLFPKLKIIYRDEISKIEPEIIKNRDINEKLAALYNEDGYGVNYDLLSESFVKEAKKQKSVKINLGEKVKKIIKGESYTVFTDKNEYESKIVIVCSGAHSLIFAKSLDYGLDYGLLPVAGSFFGTKKKFLNGKVYTLQIEKLPFAAIHGDPYVDNPNETRFGPTAITLPLLERHHYRTIPDFLRTSTLKISGITSIFKILSDPIMFNYMLKNIIYHLPLIGKNAFLKEIRKIVPSIKNEDLVYKNGCGGIRPQMINFKTKELEMGDAKICGENIIFNITPSPGASVCLKNAELDAKKIIEFLKKNFNTDFKFYEKEFKGELS